MTAPWIAALCLALAGASHAQDAAPAGPSPETQSPAQPQTPAQRWQSLSEEDRQRVQRNWERWKAMSPDDREAMTSRHQTLETMGRRIRETLEPDESARLAHLKDPEQRREMLRRTTELLRAYRDVLSEDFHGRAKQELEGLPPTKRVAKMRALLKEEIVARLPHFLDALVQDGKLDAAEAADLRQKIEAADGPERFHILRRFLLEDPEQFGITPELREPLRQASDPVRAMRMVEEMRGTRARARKEAPAETDGAREVEPLRKSQPPAEGPGGSGRARPR